MWQRKTCPRLLFAMRSFELTFRTLCEAIYGILCLELVAMSTFASGIFSRLSASVRTGGLRGAQSQGQK